MRKKQKSHMVLAGFTLIELLVVVSIIALLMSVIFASLNKARMKARDTTRIATLNQMKAALNLFYDKNSRYPTQTSWVYSTSGSDWLTDTSGATFSPTYISTIPLDPVNSTSCAGATGPWNGGANYCYAYQSPAPSQIYDLVTLLEDVTNQYRCELKIWTWHTNGETPWCPTYSNYLYTEH